MNIFKGKNKEEAKSIYKQQAKILHPDCGGNEDDFKALNKAYHDFIDGKCSGGFEGFKEQDLNDLEKQLAKKVADLLHLDLDIDIVGSFIWISGNTYECKDTLKANGFKWASKKKMWFFGEMKKGKKIGEMDYKDITSTYGKKTIRKRRSLSA